MSLFTQRFKELRTESGKTQAAIALDFGMTPQALSYYANGREPNYDLLIRFAKYFEVSVDYLIGNSDMKRPENAQITSTIGLTQDSIEKIRKYQGKMLEFISLANGGEGLKVSVDRSRDTRTTLDVLNQLIESIHFTSLVNDIQVLSTAAPDRVFSEDENVVYVGDTLLDAHFREWAISRTTNIIQEIKAREYEKAYPGKQVINVKGVAPNAQQEK